MGGVVNGNKLISKLLDNAKKLKHGEVSLTLKIHDGKIAWIKFSDTLTSKEPGGPIADFITENDE